MYRYGDDAGRITNNSLGAVTNLGFTAYNFSHLGVKAVAKRTAKDAGRALVNDYENRPLGSVGENDAQLENSDAVMGDDNSEENDEERTCDSSQKNVDVKEPI